VLDLSASGDRSACDCESVSQARHLRIKFITAGGKIFQSPAGDALKFSFFPAACLCISAYSSVFPQAFIQ